MTTPASSPAEQNDETALTVRPNPPMPEQDELNAIFEASGLRGVWRHGCDTGMVAP